MTLIAAAAASPLASDALRLTRIVVVGLIGFLALVDLATQAILPTLPEPRRQGSRLLAGGKRSTVQGRMPRAAPPLWRPTGTPWRSGASDALRLPVEEDRARRRGVGMVRVQPARLLEAARIDPGAGDEPAVVAGFPDRRETQSEVGEEP